MSSNSEIAQSFNETRRRRQRADKRKCYICGANMWFEEEKQAYVCGKCDAESYVGNQKEEEDEQ